MPEGLIYRAAKQSEADPAEYILSDETIDRYGDVISADGWDLTEFKPGRNPVALFNHNANAVIGRWENVRVENKRLLGRLILAAEGTSQLADEVRRLIQQKLVRAVSVGFLPTAKEPLTKDADEFWGPFRYLKQQLIECSVVAVPANPNALQVARSFQLSTDVREQLFGKIAEEKPRAPAVALPGKVARSVSIGGTPMKVSKKIEALHGQLNRLRDQLTALSENEDPSEEDIKLIEQLPDEIEQTQRELEMTQRVERALAVQSVDSGDGGNAGRQDIILPHRPFRAPAKKVEPLDFFIRAATCAALTKLKQEPIERIRQQLYGEDEATMWTVRAVTNPALTTVPGWAAELVETATAAFLDLLMPDTIFPVLRGRGLSFTFGPQSGTIRVPARTATPTLAGAWVGEGQPIPVRRLGLTSALLTPKKLAVISTFSHEIADYSTPSIETIIRDAMQSDTALVIDTYLLDDQAATAIRPAGLRNGVAGLTPSAATDPTQAMIADIRALVGAILSVNGGRDVVVVMNTLQEMSLNFAQTPAAGFLFPNVGEASRRFNVTFASSTAVPVGTVLAVDAADFATASGDTPDFNVSDQATIHEEDTTPLPINAGTPANPIRSLWQTDTIGIRMRLPLNWTMRRPGMVSWMEDVLW